jgi:hypothetical protein
MSSVLTLSSKITQNSTTSTASGSAANMQQQPPNNSVNTSSQVANRVQTLSSAAIAPRATGPQVKVAFADSERPCVLTLFSKTTQNSTTDMSRSSSAGMQQQPPDVPVDTSSQTANASQTLASAATVPMTTGSQVRCLSLVL